MKLLRIEIGYYPDARHRFIVPPQECIEDRTIFLNEVKVLSMFFDKRPLAVLYMKEILKAIGVPKHRELLHWFHEEMPPSGYLEMDYLSGRLSYCSVEKI